MYNIYYLKDEFLEMHQKDGFLIIYALRNLNKITKYNQGH